MIDYQATLYDPIYAAIGVDATLTPAVGDPVVIVVIDKSAGVEIPTKADSEMQTMLPAAIVRMVEITAAGLSRAAVKDAALLMNGKNWVVDSSLPKPSPAGELDGELYLILSEADA